MNAVEHIVESYFRFCRGCFTMADYKVPNGNNRQFDLLAFNVKTGEQYHIESGVTHCENWCPTTKKLVTKFNQKFLGVPKEKEGENTDFGKGKTYKAQIWAGYRSVGFDPEKVQRLWCCWDVKDRDQLPAFLESYKAETGITVKMLWFPEDVLEALLKEVATANYDDGILRTMSLLRELQRRQIDKGGEVADIIKRLILIG